MGEEEALLDHLRCNRTDGRQWRCKRRVMDNLKLCDIHYLQGRHRQYKEKVPESLKMQRQSKKAINRDKCDVNVGIRALEVGNLAKLKKRKRSDGVSEVLDETLKKMRSKRGDMQSELIKMVLKREVQKIKKNALDKKMKNKVKMKKKNKKNEVIKFEENSDRELRRELPNGLMAISPAPSPRHSGNAGPSCDVKVGVKLRTVQRRRFRSKNSEHLPLGTLQALPFDRSIGKLKKVKRKKCHWCQRSDSLNLTKCSRCQKEFFCMDCIKERYFDMQKEVEKACPVCCGNCNCKDCSVNKDTESKDFAGDKTEVEKVLRFHYLICMLLPILKQINKEKNAELETEAVVKGRKQSEIQVKQIEFGSNELCYCNKCKDSIVDLFRSCPSCSYKLCLTCCRDVFQESYPVGSYMSISKYLNGKETCIFGKKQLSKKKKTFGSASLSSCTSLAEGRGISCPSTKYGGCSDSILDLTCIFPLSWTKELEVSADEIVCSYDFPESMDISSSCPLCLQKDHKADRFEQFQEAAARNDSNDNLLYYPRLLDIRRDNLDHFQRHWVKGQPVIVRNVLHTSNLSWDPLVIFCNYLEKTSSNTKDLPEASTCLDWCEVEFGIKRYFMGSLKGGMHTSTSNEMLKLKGWLSSHLFQEQFPAHYAEIIQSLPLQDYMNPKSGLLNLAAKLPQENVKPDLGPCIYISYGCAYDNVQTDSLTRLCYDSYDVVNILAHSTDVPVSTEQLTRIIELLQKQKVQRESSVITNNQMKEDTKEKESSLRDEKTEELQSQILIGDEMHLSRRSARVCSATPNSINKTQDGKTNWKKCLDKMESSHCNGQKLSTETSGAQWDIFRRQDVPKLIEYLRIHSNEFHPCEHVVHPILDQSFFLDITHKMRLKEEFKIEPWTFEQRVGEAVIVPAGCPYQIRNSKSSVHVVSDFVSPENVAESIRLIDEIRLLPEDHRARVDKLEVKRMALRTISLAINEIRELTCAMQATN